MADKGMEKMLRRAREMKEKQDRRLAETVVDATVADGKIEGKMNGHRALLSIRVDPDLIRLDHREALEQHVVELVNNLVDQMDEILETRFGIVDKMPSLSIDNIFGR